MPFKIHEARLAVDGSGAVFKGAIIDEHAALALRRAGADIVVCGDYFEVNRQKALEIEASVGPWLRQQRHQRSAGPLALPHFQQRTPPPIGHTFYETDKLKARKT